MGGRRCAAVAVHLALGTVLLAGCVSPAIDNPGYRGKIGHSAEQMHSSVASALLAVRLDLQGKMLDTVTDNVVTDAENDADSILTAFEAVQPPDAESVQLRTRADKVLQDAAGSLADLRIAVRRHDAAGKRRILGELEQQLKSLDGLRGLA